MAEEAPAEAGRYRYCETAEIALAPDRLWPLLGEAEQWKSWSFLTRSFLLREGSPEPDGVGALRRFAVGPFGSVEEVVAFEPPRHLAYVAHKGMPVRRYRADVTLEPNGGGTQLTWSGSLEPLVPGTGPLVVAYARTAIRRFVRDLKRYSGRRAG